MDQDRDRGVLAQPPLQLRDPPFLEGFAPREV
jgi:hypothetical protein